MLTCDKNFAHPVPFIVSPSNLQQMTSLLCYHRQRSTF